LNFLFTVGWINYRNAGLSNISYNLNIITITISLLLYIAYIFFIFHFRIFSMLIKHARAHAHTHTHTHVRVFLIEYTSIDYFPESLAIREKQEVKEIKKKIVRKTRKKLRNLLTFTRDRKPIIVTLFYFFVFMCCNFCACYYCYLLCSIYSFGFLTLKLTIRWLLSI